MSGKEIIMSRQTTPITTETAALAQTLLGTLGNQESFTIGNPETGISAPLPPHIAQLIRQVLTCLAAGREVTISENLTELTPNEAADVLNVSRTYIIKLLDDGVLPYRLVGTHRRIPYADLLAHKTEVQARSRAALDELYEIDRELGLDQLDGPPPDKSVYRTDRS
jgi:excisionase family DNA binding protein